MKIVDTYKDILNTFPTSQFALETWKKYALTISPSLANVILKDSSKYDFNKEILPVIKNALAKRVQLEILHTNFISVTKNLEKDINDKFNINIDVSIILYLGLCNGAGWYTKVNNKRVVLLGIEKIIELDWIDITSLKALIYHELGHVWHDMQREGMGVVKNSSIFQLYQEGIAMVFEQSMFDDINYYHQNRDGWLDWCLSNEKEIKGEYLKRINNNESVQDFFGDWCNYKGYSDVGYFLGTQFVRYMRKKYSLTEIANMNGVKIYQEYDKYCIS